MLLTSVVCRFGLVVSAVGRLSHFPIGVSLVSGFEVFDGALIDPRALNSSIAIAPSIIPIPCYDLAAMGPSCERGAKPFIGFLVRIMGQALTISKCDFNGVAILTENGKASIREAAIGIARTIERFHLVDLGLSAG